MAASVAGPDPVATVPVPVPDRGWARAGGQVVPPGGGWLALPQRTISCAWTSSSLCRELLEGPYPGRDGATPVVGWRA